ncbi:MAG: hypothetical protein WC814_01610 [Candidatus Paceibacterota bacterium]|jgi:hypothetical protein
MKRTFKIGGVIILVLLLSGGFIRWFFSPFFTSDECKYYQERLASRACYALDGTIIPIAEQPGTMFTIRYDYAFGMGPGWSAYSEKESNGQARFWTYLNPHTTLPISTDGTRYIALYYVGDNQSGKDNLYLGLFSLPTSARGPFTYQDAVLVGSGKRSHLSHTTFEQRSDGVIQVSYKVTRFVDDAQPQLQTVLEDTVLYQIIGDKIQEIQ